MRDAAAQRNPDLALLDRLLAAGRVTHMTLAPELDGALDLIDVLVARGARCAPPRPRLIAPGAAADVVILDDNLELVRVLVNGQEPVALR